jgi:putative (di)nucleoside polyphosphate hydrolase
LLDKNKLPYRLGVGMMLVNKDNKIFVGKRIDSTAEAWQMPQGGVDEGEDTEQAALRELEEEAGTRNAKIIAESKEWHYYDLPDDLIPKLWGGKYRGQKQKWFCLRFLGEDSEINIATEHAEFHQWKWVDIETLPDIIVPFKRDVYAAVVAEFRAVIG